jgi:D-amino peptidase
MMQGIDSTFSPAVLIGYYASEGQFPAVLVHNLSSQRIMQLKLNGVAIPDAALAAAIAGDFGVLLVFASGDQTFAEQIKRLLGPMEAVAVKQAIGFNAATMLPPQETQLRIREGVKRAIERRGEMKPYRLSRPITLEVTFKQTVNAEPVSYLPGGTPRRRHHCIHRSRYERDLALSVHDHVPACKLAVLLLVEVSRTQIGSGCS